MAKKGTDTGRKKTECPITRTQFDEHAKPVKVEINGETKVASPKEYKTGSFGWFLTEKVVVEIDGVPCKVQTQVQMTVVGSKEAKD